MNTNSHFSDRLILSMQLAGYEPKPAVLEREFNLRYWGKSVTLQGVRRWLRGEAVPADDKLEVLAQWLKVDKHYLRFGEVAAKSMREQAVQLESRMSVEERGLVELFLKLPLEDKKVIGTVIKTFSRCHAEH